MTRCERCGSAMYTEPFEDAQGSGDALCCMSCGHTVETYRRFRSGIPTAAEFARLGQAGRPRKVGT